MHLNIVSLLIDSNNTISNIDSTGVGIWCSLSFIIAIGLIYLLGKYLKTIYKTIKFIFFSRLLYDSSHYWSNCIRITNLIAFAFICILIDLDANKVTPYNSMISTVPTKIQILKAQLAIAMISLLFLLSLQASYIYPEFPSHLPLLTHTSSVDLLIPIPTRSAKY